VARVLAAGVMFRNTVMPKRVKLTEEQLADEFTAIAVKHLDKLPADEREHRIQAFQKRISSGAKPVGPRAAPSGTRRTPR
jgi:hypothetical protein